MSNRQQLEQAIAIQESLRGTIDDAIIDATLNALHAQLATLEAATAPESRRTQATILFMDLAGHTDMIQGRDPEEIMEIIDHALEKLATPISQYGGRIVRYQGDGFKAVFGLPIAQEHDPDNAVLAGLDILAMAGGIAAELETERGLSGFQVRVGIDTGLVLIGGGTEGEDAVTGLPVNLAARLESAAAPGTVLISHHTYQHIRGVFDFQPLEAIQAKGFPEPVPVYRVLRRKARSFRTRRRGVEGVETRMIGRTAELAALQDLFTEMIARRACVSAVVVGEAGLGKSRLLYEFENWADLQPATVQLYRGRARLETQGLPYGLLRDIFVFRCGIHDDDATAAVRAKIVDGFRAVLGAGETTELKAHIVGHLLGYDFADSPFVRPLLTDARQLRGQALFYMTEYFKSAADRNPLLLLLEDLHWADDSSLDAVASLAAALMENAVMFLGAARPSLYERRPDWMVDYPTHRRIDVSLLGPADSDSLVTEILQRADNVPQRLRELIVERSEGNPFYVEELIKMLIEDGVIVKGEQIWRVEDDKLADLHIPPTLVGILQARLDALPARERDGLQMASVFGRLFWDAAVAYLDNPQAVQVDGELWRDLQRRELVYWRDESAFEGVEEYVFKHAILRDVTYESVLRRLRRDYHRRAAEWLIKAGGDRVDVYADQIAAHFASAGATREEAVWQGRAGKSAANRFALAEAVRALSRALDLIPPDDRAGRYEMLLERTKVYDLQATRELQEADLIALEALAIDMDDYRKRAEIANQWAHYHLKTGAYGQTRRYAEEGYDYAERADDDSLRALALLYQGNALMFLGEYAAAQALMLRSLDEGQTAGAQVTRMNTLRTLGILSEEQGDFTEQKKYYEGALALARELGDRAGERRALNSLGVAAQGQGDYKSASSYYNESLAIARAIGDRIGEGTVLGNMGVQTNHVGHYSRSCELFEQSLRIARETDDPTGVNINLLNLAVVMVYLNNTEEALRLFGEALAGVEETGDRPLEGYILSGLGMALLWDGRASEAISPLRQAIELRQELGQPHLVVESRAYLAQALAAEGYLSDAVAEAGKVLDFLQDGRLEEAEDLLRILLATYWALDAAQDGRASAVLSRAYEELQSLAAHLDEELRQSYLDKVSGNRTILALWAERSGA